MAPGFLGQYLQRALGRLGFAIRSFRRQFVEHVGHRDDTGIDVNRIPFDSVGVAGAIHPLVVVANAGDELVQRRHAFDDGMPGDGMGADGGEFGIVERALFVEDMLRQRDLAKIVEDRRIANLLDITSGEIELRGKLGRVVGNPGRVAPGV